MANGRVKGQISLGKGKISFTQNKNSGTNRGGQTGSTKLARSINNATSGVVAQRNSRSKTAYSANAGQTVGLKGAKVGYVHRRAPVANSVPDRTTKNPSQYNTHVSSTIGLKGAGKPFANQKRTSTQFDNVGDKIPANQRKFNPHAAPTVGLKGAKLGNTLGTASRSNLARGASDKNSANTTKFSAHVGKTQGLKRASKRAPKQSLQSHGTPGKTGGGKGIAFTGNRRQVTSSLPPQKVYSQAIPAAVRRAASRAPSVGSSKPSFTSRIAKILSK